MKKPLFATYLVLLFTGFGATPPSVPVSAETPLVTSQVSPTSPNASTPLQPQVELLNPGSEPRQILRFEPAANAKQTTIMTMSMDMSGTVESESIPTMAIPTMDFPTITMTLEAATKPLNNGDIQIDFAYSNVDVGSDTTAPPDVLEMMRSQLQILTAVKMSYVIDNQGNTKNVNIILPDKLDPNLKQFVDQLLNSLEQFAISPFPNEAVGVGAKWQIVSSLPLMGLPANEMKMIYEVGNIQDDQVTLNVTMGMQGGSLTSTELPFPGLPPDLDLTIKSMAIQSTGTLILELDQIMPISGRTSTVSNMEMSINNPNINEPMNMKMNSTIDMTIESPF